MSLSQNKGFLSIVFSNIFERFLDIVQGAETPVFTVEKLLKAGDGSSLPEFVRMAGWRPEGAKRGQRTEAGGLNCGIRGKLGVRGMIVRGMRAGGPEVRGQKPAGGSRNGVSTAKSAENTKSLPMCLLCDLCDLCG